MGQNGADYSETWVRQSPPRVPLESLAQRASLRTIGDWIVLEYLLGEGSLPSLRWGKMVQTTPGDGSAKVHTTDLKAASCTVWKGEKKVPEGPT